MILVALGRPLSSPRQQSLLKIHPLLEPIDRVFRDHEPVGLLLECFEKLWVLLSPPAQARRESAAQGAERNNDRRDAGNRDDRDEEDDVTAHEDPPAVLEPPRWHTR